MISDQSPSNLKKAIWVKFFNQDTACLHGAEFYSKKYDIPIIFGDVQRKKRRILRSKTVWFEDNRKKAEGNYKSFWKWRNFPENCELVGDKSWDLKTCWIAG